MTDRSRFPAWMTIVLLALVVPDVHAQDVAAAAPFARTDAIAKVAVDLSAGAFDRVLPFDVPFFVVGRLPPGTTRVDVQFAAVPESGDVSALAWMPHEPARWQPGRPADSSTDTFMVLVNPPLQAGRTYRTRFVLRDGREQETTAFADGRTAQKNYVSVDAGILLAGDISKGAVYIGANVYFRPINKDAPLNAISSFGRRVALTAGVTLSSVADEGNRTRSDLFWHQSLVLGAGYRLTSSLRGGGGVLVFRQSDPNPLVTHDTIAATWYASFSLDLDILRGVAR